MSRVDEQRDERASAINALFWLDRPLAITGFVAEETRTLGRRAVVARWAELRQAHRYSAGVAVQAPRPTDRDQHPASSLTSS